MRRKILLLGNPILYEVCKPVQKEELTALSPVIDDLHDTLIDYKATYHAGRAISAPQIGVQKRLIYLLIEKPMVIINPTLEFIDDEMMTVMDDCMSFPNLLVEIYRYKTCIIRYLDLYWKECSLELEGDLSELLQHECDHLDGMLATMRSKNNKSFYIKNDVELSK